MRDKPGRWAIGARFFFNVAVAPILFAAVLAFGLWAARQMFGG